MTTTKETCPKCGEISMSNYALFVYFACDTKVYTDGSVKDGEYCKLRCRITELEKENERLRDDSRRLIEKAKEVLTTYWGQTFSAQNEAQEWLINHLALEFTKYQKRIDELEKDLIEVCEYTMHAMWCATLVPIINLKCNCGASDLHERIKYHLAKGVKEEG
jgi:predicted RNase H-like nuclease (RuvC/YqgF family)